jgi:hypothetical protein
MYFIIWLAVPFPLKKIVKDHANNILQSFFSTGLSTFRGGGGEIFKYSANQNQELPIMAMILPH